jgi:hypothetical protein
MEGGVVKVQSFPHLVVVYVLEDFFKGREIIKYLEFIKLSFRVKALSTYSEVFLCHFPIY